MSANEVVIKHFERRRLSPFILSLLQYFNFFLSLLFFALSKSSNDDSRHGLVSSLDGDATWPK